MIPSSVRRSSRLHPSPAGSSPSPSGSSRTRRSIWFSSQASTSERLNRHWFPILSPGSDPSAASFKTVRTFILR
jgi:hypothetical protein